uniref:Uncharacterized protein n=1 Tax=Populus trichocarpa TaxID=3694 RepID=A0A3N7F7M8_POPTR
MPSFVEAANTRRRPQTRSCSPRPGNTSFSSRPRPSSTGRSVHCHGHRQNCHQQEERTASREEDRGSQI